MKLHAVNGKRSVPHAHDRPIVGPRAGFEVRWHWIGDHQGMIPARRECLRDASKNTRAVLLDRRDLAVHQFRRSHDRSAKRHANALMPEADSEKGSRRTKLSD